MRKVIYVSFIRLTDKVARDWYIDYLVQKGAIVEYWDVIALLREEHSEHGARVTDYLHLIQDYPDLVHRLRQPENRGALYVMLVNYGGQFTQIFRLLSKFNCRMLFIAWGAMPKEPVVSTRRLARMMRRPLTDIRVAFYMAKGIAWRRLNLVKPFDVVFAAGRVLLESDQHAAKVVPINLCDYDCYLEAKSLMEVQTQGRYAVFLDINLPYQSDLAICGYKRIEAGKYFRSLNRFFSLLEREHQLRIVIAAHPKAAYGPSTFEGREIHRLVTAELVRDAQYVLCHTSTAVSYAVLNEKPLIFIYTDDMKLAYRSNFMRNIRCCAEYLGAPVHNIDSVIEGRQIIVRSPDAARYKRYKYDFLTTRETEDLLNREIFWRELNAC